MAADDDASTGGTRDAGPGGRRVVVGVDGSDHALRALREAASEAELRDASLVVVVAWPSALTWPGMVYGVGPEEQRMAALEAEFQGVLDEALAEVEVRVPVERVVRRGPAAPALIDEAEGALLLVVGSRGRGGFRGLVLGSTSAQVTGHAPCPVLVVP